MIKAYKIMPRKKIWSEVVILRVRVSGASVGVGLLLGFIEGCGDNSIDD